MIQTANVNHPLNECFDEKQTCCGCNACVQVCPKKCITLNEDSEGFLYPVVDNMTCINCKLCKKVCPILNAKPRSEEILGCYVGYLKDDNIRFKSSSGGIFYPLAQSILDQGGIVFGVAFDEDWNAHHISIDNTNDLPLLMGSKYIQSRTENTFTECKKSLDEGKHVLYSGVACQIAGLKSFLKKDYDNLLTIDVLCHGTPSPKVWQRYLDWRKEEYQSNLKKIEFRNKETTWSKFSLKIKFRNEKEYIREFTQDYYYYYYFLQNIGLRPSCHHCQFKALERPSDITLGDAWGINNHHPELNDEHGTSVILIHSEKGRKVFEQLSSQLNYQSVDVNVALPKTADSRKSVLPDSRRTKFFEKINTDCSYEQLLPLIKKKKPGLTKRAWRKFKRLMKKLLHR